MKKKIVISIVAVTVLILIALVLFLPVSHEIYDDGGTEVHSALTYKIVKWKKFIVTSDGKFDTYNNTSVYWFANRFKSIDELWKIEKERQASSLSGGEEKYKLQVVYKNGSWNKEGLKDSYAAGETVTIKLEAITEQYYKVYVNGKEQPISSSNLEFLYYYFKMPSEDVTVEIEEHWVEIPSSLGFIFSEYLDSIKFTERLSQSDLLDILEKYSYNGKTITDDMNIAFVDDMYGGGMFGGTTLFGFENDYTVTEDSQYANYLNEFYTSVNLEGFSLPHGIKFEYTLDNVLQNLKPYLNLPDDLNQENIILYSDDKSVLELTSFLATSENEPNYSYELKYTEIYKITLNDGREDNVTRCVSMRFTNGDNKLGLFTVYVNENYATNKVEG